ncbi:hypothetical protein T265_01527 [Opisthorchis viverrini]|uniref:Homeobox domain protein n=1 Tax=Opisthorchis viverrini TaxID=6198 RepID=A0A075AIZ2_OPIVI|nr:hypothetical protein T265_01527 [Opisthorchis viverrini]KER32479.1 hypothetical protein T265_01527 [Opisthorchis viverrini]
MYSEIAARDAGLDSLQHFANQLEVYHPDCLKCARCGEQLSAMDRRCWKYKKCAVLCLQCRIRLTHCARCRLRVAEDALVHKFDQVPFHVACLTCDKCRCQLRPGDKCGLLDDRLYCIEHYLSCLMMSGFYDPSTDPTEPMSCTERVEATSNDYERPQTIQGRTMEPDSRRSNTCMQTHKHIVHKFDQVPFHVACLTCDKCRCQLRPGDKCGLLDDRLYCIEHYLSCLMMSGFYDPSTDPTEPMSCTERVEATSNDYERPQTIQGRTMEPDSRRSNTCMQTHKHIDNVICPSEANDETGTTRHTGIHGTDMLRPEEEPVKNKADSPFLHQSLNRRSASVPIPQKHDNLVSSSAADSLYPDEELIEMDDMAPIAITAASASLLSTESPFVTAENSGHSIDSSTSSGCSVHSKSKRIRTSFTPDQLAILQANFDVEANPDGQELERIANVARLNKRVTQVWFQNARARKKKIECKGLGPFSHLTMNCSAYYLNESNASKEDLVECDEDGHPQSQNHSHSGEQLASFLYDPFSSIKPMTFPCGLIDFPSIPIPPASFLHPFVNIAPADLEQHLSNGFNEITYPNDRSNSSLTCPRYLHSKVPEFVLKDMGIQVIYPVSRSLSGETAMTKAFAENSMSAHHWFVSTFHVAVQKGPCGAYRASQHNLWSELFLSNTIRHTSPLLIRRGYSNPDGNIIFG